MKTGIVLEFPLLEVDPEWQAGRPEDTLPTEDEV